MKCFISEDFVLKKDAKYMPELVNLYTLYADGNWLYADNSLRLSELQ
jgi:hypothetical protein